MRRIRAWDEEDERGEGDRKRVVLVRGCKVPTLSRCSSAGVHEGMIHPVPWNFAESGMTSHTLNTL